MEADPKKEPMDPPKPARAVPDGRGRLGDFLNAPFTVTLLGGLILAVVSATLSQLSAESVRQRDLALEKQRQRQVFVDTFAYKVKMYFEMTLSVRKREIFLGLWQGQPDRDQIKYPDGRSFLATRDKYESDLTYWLDHSTGTPGELIYTAEILFTDPKVCRPLEAMRNAAADYQAANDEATLNKACTSTLTAVEDAAKAMADETH